MAGQERTAASRRTRRQAVPDSLDPVQIALQSDEAENHAAILMRKQSLLIDADLRHRGYQIHRERLHIASERMGLALKVMMALGAVLLAAVLVWMAWTAQRAEGLVITAFSAPPDLVVRGLTGEAVSAQLLDALGRISDRSAASIPQGQFRGLASDDISLEIPRTGISVDDIDRLLRRWLSREVPVSGEVFRTAAGLSVTTRTGTGSRTVAGPAEDLSPLIDQTAEQIFAASQPARYGFYLISLQKRDEARAVFDRVIATGAANERAQAYFGRANLSGFGEGARSDWQEAIRLDPGLHVAMFNLSRLEEILGHPEAAYKLEVRRLGVERRGGYYRKVERPVRLAVAQARVSALAGDYQEAARLYGSVENSRISGMGTRTWITPQVESLLMLHDANAAKALMTRRGKDAVGDPAPPINLWRSFGDEDWPAVAAADQQALAQLDEAVKAGAPGTERAAALALTASRPRFAYGLARTGRIAEARAAIAATPLDCQPCVLARAKISAQAKDWTSADHWFAEAVRMAPSLPFAQLEWGDARLARGDFTGAIGHYRTASRKSPRFADPLHRWGEALLRKGDFRAAIGKFTAADERAPNWGRNHLLWGQALEELGRHDQAMAQWRKASGLGLSAADKATVARLLQNP